MGDSVVVLGDTPKTYAAQLARTRPHPVPYCVAALVSIGIMVYALTRAFVWDEGFHLVAAQSILNGKSPYLDFCFPQTPLNAYWNAAWMGIFGQGWRVPHVAAALLMAATLFVVAEIVLRYVPLERWKAPCASAAVLMLGLHYTVVQFGPIAQAYAMCMFAATVGYLFTLIADERESTTYAAAAGLFAGIASGSSLLSGPVTLVLFLWICIKAEPARRWKHATAYLAGCFVAFLPVTVLLLRGPHQTFFNIVTYQALFRRVNWAGATPHDAEVLSGWIDDGPTLLLAVLAIASALYVRRSGWHTSARHAFELASYITAAVVAYISTAHPTFGRYYIVVMPFLAITAAPGLYFLGDRLLPGRKTSVAIALVSIFTVLAISRAIFLDRDSATWARYEQIAAKVAAVTPTRARLFADEHVYFLLHRTPPPGMEFSYAHKIELSKADEQQLHIISDKELEARMKAGQYDTFQTCNEDRPDEWHLTDYYENRADIEDCSIFWGHK